MEFVKFNFWFLLVHHQLQQFRQKKDGKGTGSQGKSVKKLGKLEQHEADADDKPTSVPLAAEGEITSHVDSDPSGIASSTSHSTENIVSGSDVSVVDLSAVPSTLESSVVETLTAHNELTAPSVGVGEHGVNSLVQTQGKSTAAEVAKVTSLVNSDAMDSGGESSYGNTFVSNAMQAQPASDESIRVAVTVESQSVHLEDNPLPSRAEIVDSEHESLPLRDDIPDTSLLQAREDQVTDVGCALLLLLLFFFLLQFEESRCGLGVQNLDFENNFTFIICFLLGFEELRC